MSVNWVGCSNRLSTRTSSIGCSVRSEVSAEGPDEGFFPEHISSLLFSPPTPSVLLPAHGLRSIPGWSPAASLHAAPLLSRRSSATHNASEPPWPSQSPSDVPTAPRGAALPLRGFSRSPSLHFSNPRWL